jgi:hypothetical protein
VTRYYCRRDHDDCDASQDKLALQGIAFRYERISGEMVKVGRLAMSSIQRQVSFGQDAFVAQSGLA